MRKGPRPDQIAAIVNQIQADLEAGLNVNQACRKGRCGAVVRGGRGGR